MSGNVLAGGIASQYPGGNFFPPVADFLAQFVNPSAGDYRLAPSSPFNNAATDNTDVGVDFAKLTAVQGGQ